MRGGAQIAVVVGIRKHQRRGMRKGDCGRNQREPRSAKWMVVVEEREVGEGESVLCSGGLLVQ